MGLGCHEKGQAAVTDALYFLLIVTGLTIFLFAFANSYGGSVSESIEGQFTSDYATNALKTILYVSTPRDPSKTIYDEGAEIDSLLAYLKEDYADGEERTLEKETQLVLAQDVNAVMNPLAPAYDYLFYIYRPAADESIYAFLHLSNITVDPRYSTIVDIIPPDDAERAGHTDYICDIPGSVIEKVNRLSANAGSTAHSTATIKLTKINPSDLSFSEETARASILIWPSSLVRGVFTNEADLGWNCCDVEDLRNDSC